MRFNPFKTDGEGYRRLLAWNRHLASGPLDPSVRSLVETRVSQINGCAYCLAMHADEARHAGVSQQKLDLLAAWRDSTSFSAEERAALAIAEAMSRISDGGRVDDEVRSTARDHFDDSSLAALLQVVAMINAFNQLNVATERTAEDYHRRVARVSRGDG